jgi:CBS domain-containing protein
MEVDMAVQTISEVMTKEIVTLPPKATLREAAEQMKSRDIGAVVILDDKSVSGIVTDRDLVVRGLAEGKDPAKTTLSEVSSRELTTLSPDDDVEKAVELMKDKAVRRLPVVQDGKPVGIVSLGDLAVERGEGSALAKISSATANK